MIQVIASPYLLFVWPQKGTNPGWSFIWGQSLCLQWHHKCPRRENNGWWIQREPGTVDSTDARTPCSVMESFQTIKGPRLGQRLLLKCSLCEVGGGVGEIAAVWAGGQWRGRTQRCPDHRVITLNVYMKLCVGWRQSETGLSSLGKKEALFL